MRRLRWLMPAMRSSIDQWLAILTPDDAAVVQAALEAELETQWRAEHTSDNDDDSAEVTAPLPTATRRLDALVGVAANRLEVGPVPIVRGEHTEVVIHIDEAFLRGDTDGGLCDAKNAPGLSLADARRLAVAFPAVATPAMSTRIM